MLRPPPRAMSPQLPPPMPLETDQESEEDKPSPIPLLEEMLKTLPTTTCMPAQTKDTSSAEDKDTQLKSADKDTPPKLELLVELLLLAQQSTLGKK